jgi:hypothetical protein
MGNFGARKHRVTVLQRELKRRIGNGHYEIQPEASVLVA